MPSKPRPIIRASLTALLLVATSAPAQQPAFDVASIKPHQTEPNSENRQRIDSAPGSLTMRNVNLRDCIKWAYGVKDYQIAGPSSLDSEKYDISAKAAGRASLTAMKEMLQVLLRDRFHMQFHRASKEMQFYELVVAKSGPKLHNADPSGNTDMRGRDGSFQFRNTSMQQFAEDLAALTAVARPVLDRTGIPGNFDFDLNFGSAFEMKTALNGGDGPSIFTLLQEQLGLQLKSGKGPIEQLVVDSADRIPGEN
jgi:uncharacterized protein (TIGR03435 family)